MVLKLGCTDYMKTVLGNDYRTGNVYGTLYYLPGNVGDKFFEVWTLGIWHSFCIIISKTSGFVTLYLDGVKEIEIDEYTGFLKNAASNIILLNDIKGKQIVKTAITDVNIWKEVKEVSFIKKWSECESEEEGDYLKWSESQLNLVNVEVENKNNRSFKTIFLLSNINLSKQQLIYNVLILKG